MNLWKTDDGGAYYWVIARTAEKAEEILRECFPEAIDNFEGEFFCWTALRSDEEFTYHFDDGTKVTLSAKHWCDLMYTSVGFIACSEW